MYGAHTCWLDWSSRIRRQMVTTELRPRAVTGRLKLGKDNSFEMELQEGRLVTNLAGDFDVNDGILLVYTARDSDDIITALNYRYSRKSA